MKKLYFAFLALFLSFVAPTLFAQTPNWDWADAAGDHGNESASSVAIDGSGNAYVTGSYTSAFINFGAFTPINTFSGTGDIFLAKYDPTGLVLWANTIGGADGDASNSVTVDVSGNVLITGWFTSPSITFGTTVLTNSSTASSDYYLAKYDPAGNVIWAISAGGTMNDRAADVSTDGSGNIFVVGWYTSPTINFGTGTHTNSNPSSNEIFVVKYDPNGNALWSKSIGGTNFDAAYGCEADASGNLYLTGSYASASIDFGTGPLVNTQSNFHDFFINKYDPSGNSIWSKTAPGSYDDIGNAITVSGTNIYVTGYFSSPTVQFGSNPVLTNVGAPSPDIFIAQYSSTGIANWSQRAGGLDSDEGKCVYADASGNAYISGSFASTSISFGTGTLTNFSTGTKDVFVGAFDNAGASLWSLEVGNTGEEIGYGIAGTSTANIIYVAGMFNSGMVSFGGNDIYKGCGDDVFLAKLGTTTTALEAYSSGNDFLIYPNPSNGVFFIGNEFENAAVEIYNAIGEKVFSGSDINNRIDISANAKGVYLILLTVDKKVYSRRMIIE